MRGSAKRYAERTQTKDKELSLVAGVAAAMLLLLMLIIPLSKWSRIWAGIALTILLLSAAGPSLYSEYQLSQEGAHTAGTLAKKECRGKYSPIEYTFLVGDKKFVGRGSVGGWEQCGAYQIGQQIFVTYLPSDPNVSVPLREQPNQLFIMVLLLLSAVVFAVWANAEQHRIRKTNRAKW